MKSITVSAIALGLAVLGTVAYAQDSSAPAQHDGAFAIRRIEHRLGVSDAQRMQIKAILTTERPMIESLHESLNAERTEMNTSTSFDEARTRGIAQKYAATNTNLLVERAKLRFELLAVLTPEQRQKLEAIRTRFSSRFNQRLETFGDHL